MSVECPATLFVRHAVMVRVGCCLLLGSFVLSACATQAQIQAQRLTADMERINKDALQCVEAANAHPSASVISEKSILRGDQEFTLSMISDTSYITQEEADAVTTVHARKQPCREIQVNSLQERLPELAVVTANAYAEHDEFLVKLMARDLTWGEFNQLKRRIINEYNADALRVGRKIESALIQSHQYELGQRRAAAVALQTWAYQQQLLYSLNQPRYTNCQYLLNTISCTTY
ncbi:MAG: hypothetical protein ACE5JU_23405 [Candidatus Binatia bacterium]